MDISIQQVLEEAGLDHTRVGEHIASGKQHDVYRYGDKKVMKIPRQSWLMRVYGMFSYGDISTDLKFIEKYFAEYMVKSTVLKTSDSYVLMQEYIEGAKPLDPNTLTHQLKKILSINEALMRDHRMSLDLFGFAGFVSTLKSLAGSTRHPAMLTNIMVDPSRDKLVIVDTNLSYLGRLEHPGAWRHVLVDRVAVKISLWMIEKFFLRSV